jgi:hypothetical protein
MSQNHELVQALRERALKHGGDMLLTEAADALEILEAYYEMLARRSGWAS